MGADAKQIEEADRALAHEAMEAIRAELPEVAEHIRALVHHGHVTLEGQVPWRRQRDRAEATIRLLAGVVGVQNDLTVTPCVTPAEIKKRIEAAFRYMAAADAVHINVHADGGHVVLSGQVRSSSERIEAEVAAAAAPGVTEVRNELTVGY